MALTLLGRLVRRKFHAVQIGVPPCVHVTEEPVVCTRGQQVRNGNANTIEFSATPPYHAIAWELNNSTHNGQMRFGSLNAGEQISSNACESALVKKTTPMIDPFIRGGVMV